MYTKQISGMKYEVIFESEKELKDFKDFINPPKSLKACEAMEILGVTRVTLCHYVKQGLLKVSQAYEGSRYSYDYDSVMALKGRKKGEGVRPQ